MADSTQAEDFTAVAASIQAEDFTKAAFRKAHLSVVWLMYKIRVIWEVFLDRKFFV